MSILFFRCIALDGRWAKGYYRLGCALQDLRQEQAAISVLRKAQLLAPSDECIRQRLCELHDASVKRASAQALVGDQSVAIPTLDMQATMPGFQCARIRRTHETYYRPTRANFQRIPRDKAILSYLRAVREIQSPLRDLCSWLALTTANPSHYSILQTVCMAVVKRVTAFVEPVTPRLSADNTDHRYTTMESTTTESPGGLTPETRVVVPAPVARNPHALVLGAGVGLGTVLAAREGMRFTSCVESRACHARMVSRLAEQQGVSARVHILMATTDDLVDQMISSLGNTGSPFPGPCAPVCNLSFRERRVREERGIREESVCRNVCPCVCVCARAVIGTPGCTTPLLLSQAYNIYIYIPTTPPQHVCGCGLKINICFTMRVCVCYERARASARRERGKEGDQAWKD